MNTTKLIITSIADDENLIINQIAHTSKEKKIDFILIGDKKSPENFNIDGCDYYSVERQKALGFEIINNLPFNHYARKNIGYLVAMKENAEIIIETDDDNIPYPNFWNERKRFVEANYLENTDWTNVYKYFSNKNIWPRGFALERILNELPQIDNTKMVDAPIQQGLADDNPDVDAIYRLTMPLPIKFDLRSAIALSTNSFCPFNSQNTTWFKDAFILMYLPSYCSFRMTDIWRSFIAQRISWTCGWSVIFHNSTVSQMRNEHNLMKDFDDEIVGYKNNLLIYNELKKLKLKEGTENLSTNLIESYQLFIKMNMIDKKEIEILKKWIIDVENHI